MRHEPHPSLPPPSTLDALRQPRRPQLHDPCVKALLAQWKLRRRPIEYADLNRVAAVICVENPNARTRRKIVAAVERAGIRIRNYDSFRQWLAEGVHVQLTDEGWWKRAEEARWRWPEEWDSRPPHRTTPAPQWIVDDDLDREYGPTLKRHRWQQKRQQKRRAGDWRWFLAADDEDDPAA